MRMKEIAEYELPTDYVVIPMVMRDRIMARLNTAEARVKELEEHNNAMLTSMRRFLARLDEVGQRDESREIITVECTFAFVESLRRAIGEGE